MTPDPEADVEGMDVTEIDPAILELAEKFDRDEKVPVRSLDEFDEDDADGDCDEDYG